MKKFFLFTILLFTSIISTQLYTQTKSAAESAQIFIIFFDDYPCLRATYAVWDTSGNDMRVNNANDIIITEGGKIRTQCANSPYCSPPGNKSFSAIICVDMSISMLDPISTTDGTSRESAALSAIRSFVLALPYNTNANGKHQLQNCEVAIMQFDGGAELITGFTDQQDSLVKMTSPNNYTTRVFTDYNAAFFKDKWGNKTNTALDIAKSARYKPVIIFITDGGHDANYATPADGSEPRDGRVLLDSISYTCHSRRPTVYVFVFQIGNENLDAISKGYLSGLAGIEVGTYNGQPIKNLYLTMTDTSVISNIFANYIPAVCGTVGYPEPCEVLWKSDCMGGGDLKLNFPAYNNVSASYTFTIPDNVKPNLDVNVSSIIFKNVKAIGNYDTTIVITARQDTLDIYNPAFSSTDTRYSIISWGVKTPPFTLRKGESTTITLRYSPTDTLPSSATIKFLGSQCSGGELLCQAQAIKPPTLAADSVRIINLFFDSYPCIGATFAIIDSSGNTVKISNINDIVVKENDSVMTLCDNTPICPDSCVSVIFDIDMSLSMLDPISSTDGTTREAVVLELLRNYILALPTYTDANGKKILQNCEVAIMQFDGSGEIITGFTDNQDSLVKMSASSNFHTRVFTDYNAAFIKDKWGDSTHSALWIAKSARCKPVIVFITDGGHDANYAVPPDGSEPKDGRVLISDITNICHSRKPSVYVFAIEIGTDVVDQTSQGILSGLAGIEVGKDRNGQPISNLYMHITDGSSVSGLFDNITQIGKNASASIPCEIKWKTDCKGGGDLKLIFPNHNNLTTETHFTILDSVKPFLFTRPGNIIFNKDLPHGDYDTSVVIAAIKNSVDIYLPAYTSNDIRYTIVDWGVKGPPPFTLNKGESTTITLRYHLTDSLPSASTIHFIGSQCSGDDIMCQAQIINGVEDNEADNIKGFVLEQNYPQPFSNFTTIEFKLTRPANIKLEVLNLFGEQVYLLANGFCDAGSHNINLNAEKLNQGIYFYRLSANGYSETKKMVLIR